MFEPFYFHRLPGHRKYFTEIDRLTSSSSEGIKSGSVLLGGRYTVRTKKLLVLLVILRSIASDIDVKLYNVV